MEIFNAEFLENEITKLKQRKLEFLLSEIYVKVIDEMKEILKKYTENGIPINATSHVHYIESYIESGEYSYISSVEIEKYFVDRGWNCIVGKIDGDSRYTKSITVFFKKEK